MSHTDLCDEVVYPTPEGAWQVPQHPGAWPAWKLYFIACDISSRMWERHDAEIERGLSSGEYDNALILEIGKAAAYLSNLARVRYARISKESM